MKSVFKMFLLATLLGACGKGEVSTPSSPNGVGGSIARFCAFGELLYVVTDQQFQVYEIGADGSATSIRTILLDRGLETIFRHDSILYIGAEDGMYLFDIRDPSFPKQYAKFLHFVARDPVVADGRLAFVTLRAFQNEWGGGQGAGQLQVIDIANPRVPFLISSKQMVAPQGLALYDSLLLVCDEGIKIYLVDSALTLPSLNYIEMDAHDIVVIDGIAMVIGRDGLYQYQLTSDLRMNLLSKISTKIP
jgi:hypothetical protein